MTILYDIFPCFLDIFNVPYIRIPVVEPPGAYHDGRFSYIAYVMLCPAHSNISAVCMLVCTLCLFA